MQRTKGLLVPDLLPGGMFLLLGRRYALWPLLR